MANIKERPRLKAAALLKELTAEYYAQAEVAAAENNLAWVTAIFPVEILQAMDIFPYYPENYAAKCASRKRTEELAAVAEQRGFSPHLCAYSRIGLGASYWEDNPVEHIPKPTWLLPCYAQCLSLAKWFEAMADFYRMPYFVLDTPFMPEEITVEGYAYFLQQIRELVDFLETGTGRKMDYERLQEVVTLSAQACRLWNEVLEMGATDPAVFTYFDSAIHMAPIVTLRGTQKAVEYYATLKEELLERQREGIYAVGEERYRLYWHGIPMWHRLRYLADYFCSQQAAVVTSLYTLAWAYDFDPSRPLETLAENYLSSFINRGLAYRVEQIVALAGKYKIDGFLLFSNHSCKSDSLGLYDIKNALAQKLDKPAVIFEGDMCDDRYFEEEQVLSRLDSFFEQLEERSSGR